MSTRDKFLNRLSTIAIVAAPAVTSIGNINAESAQEPPPTRIISQSTIVEPRTNVRIERPEKISTAQTVFSTRVAASGEWTKHDERAYSKLVLKEATATLTKSEQESISQLQNKRRATIHKEPGHIILSRYKQARLDQELIDVLKKNATAIDIQNISQRAAT